jgi:hypothetical protein
MAERSHTTRTYDSSGQIDSTGSSNAYVIRVAEQISAYHRGMAPIRFKANFSNSGSASANIATELSPSGLGAVTMKKGGGADDLEADDIVSGGIYTLIYDGEFFQVLELNGASGGSVAAEDVSFTPAGSIDATDVQAAIEELDSEKQPLDADLTAIAALSGTNTLYYRSGADTWSPVTIGSGLTFSGGSLSVSTTALPRGHIFGLILSNNGTDANNDIDIAAGEARSDDNAEDISLAAAITKRLDATWAVGTGNGGLDTGSEAANTWYHVWLIKRTDTGVVDALFSTSATSPTMPANYTKKRRIGAVRNNASSNLLAFTQNSSDPELFLYTTTILDVALSNLGTTRQTPTLTVPPSTVALFRATMEAVDTAGGATVVIQPTTETNAGPSENAVPGFSLLNPTEAGTTMGAGGHFEIPVNASSQIAIRASTNNVDFNIMTRGWRDLRGRLN